MLIVAKCNMSAIGENSFSRASNLVFLNASMNNITELKDYAFRGATKMRLLELSKNQIKDISSKSFAYLDNLVALLMYDNQLTKLPDGVFSNLLKLRKLTLARNKLEIIEPEVLQHLVSLEHILLHSNRLLTVDSNIFDKMSKLEFLSLFDNQLNVLNLENNAANSVMANYNNITTLTIGKFTSTLYASDNKIDKIITPDAGEYKLKTLSMKNNSISNLKELAKFKNLIDLDLSFNPIGKLDLDTFAAFSELTDLDIEATNFTGLEHGIFSKQTKLTRLDISYNKLGHLNIEVLTPLEKLKELFIDGNDLVNFDYTQFEHTLPELNLIGLADNKWNCSFLTKFIRELRKINVKIDNSKGDSVSNVTNVNGIFCDKTQNWEKPIVHVDEKFQPKNENDTIKANIVKMVDDFAMNFSSNIDMIISEAKATKEIIANINEKLDKFNNELIDIKHKFADFTLNVSGNALNSLKTANELRQMLQNNGNDLNNRISLNLTNLKDKISKLENHFEAFKYETHKVDKEALTSINDKQEKIDTELHNYHYMPLFLIVLVIGLINSLVIGFAYYKMRIYRFGNNLRMRYRSEATLGSAILADDNGINL